MEMTKKRLFCMAIEQKRGFAAQLHVDMRQMALLLHHGTAWQLWQTQKEQSLEKARKWEKEQCLVTLAKEERKDREEIGDRGYWAIGVMAIQSDRVKAAIKQDKRRYRMNL